MQKNYCDRCGGECVNYVARLNVSEEHTTSQGDRVADAYMRRSKDLCSACRAGLEEWLGSSLGMLGEEAMEQLSRQLQAEDAEDADAKYRAVEEAHP